MSRIRVLTLIDQPAAAGGGERLAVQVATRLDRRRFESFLCAPRCCSPPLDAGTRAALEELRRAQVGFLGLGRRHKADLWPFRRLIAFLRHQRIDVLHAHKFGSNVWGTLLGRAAGVPVVICHEHSWSYVGQPVRRVLDRHLIARWSDVLIAVSREDQRRMVEVEGISLEDTVFIPNGASLSARSPGADVRAELDIPRDALVVGSVGFLRVPKRHDLLLRAVSRLRRSRAELHVVIVGEGAGRGELESLSSTLGLEARVHLLGQRLDVPDVLAALDVAVLASDSEGAPLSILEYMEAGLPIVASRVGGIPGLIEDGVQGLLVPPGDELALAQALDRVLSAPQEARRLGVAAQARWRAQFDLDAMVRRLEGLYEERLARRRATPT